MIDPATLRMGAIKRVLGREVTNKVKLWIRVGSVQSAGVTESGVLLLTPRVAAPDVAVRLEASALHAWPTASVGWAIRRGATGYRWVLAVRFDRGQE